MDLLVRYSNRDETVNRLQAVLERIEVGDQTTMGTITAEPFRRPPAQTQTLSDEQVRTIFACYRVGTGPRELSRRHGLTERAIKYLLKKHGIQRVRSGGDLLGGRP